MKPKVLITGGSGFMGFHLIQEVLQSDLAVDIAVRKSSDVSHLKNLPIGFNYLDFTSIENIKSEIEKNQYTYIIHAAGLTKAKTQQEYNNVNADYTYNLAKAVEQTQHKISKLVFLSSLAAVGPLTTLNELIDENTASKPITAYGNSKFLAEQKIASLNIPLITLRPTAIYGPREKDIFILFKTINAGFDPYIGRINQQLSFVYAKDMAAITVQSLFSNVTGTFNITDGNSYSRYELADFIQQQLNKKAFRFHLPYSAVKALAVSLETTYKLLDKVPALNKEKLNELTAANWACNINKAIHTLGYKPVYNLERGISETVKWYKENKWL